jgi:hypothetical protein
MVIVNRMVAVRSAAAGNALDGVLTEYRRIAGRMRSVAGDNKKRSVHIFTATPSNDNDQTRVWIPDGGGLILKDHEGGYFTNAYVGAKDMDDTNVQAGMGRGFVSFEIEDGGDEAGKMLIDEWRQGRMEVVIVYREWKLESGQGVWENKKVVTVWGYLNGSRLARGASTISVEVHVFRTTSVNDSLGTRDYSIDCVTGSSTIKGGTLGARTPTHIDPPGDPEADNWESPLSA